MTILLSFLTGWNYFHKMGTTSHREYIEAKVKDKQSSHGERQQKQQRHHLQQQKETNLSYRRCKQVNNPLMGNSHNALSVDLDDPVTDLMMTSINMIIIIMNYDNNNKNDDDDRETNPDSSTLSDSSS